MDVARKPLPTEQSDDIERTVPLHTSIVGAFERNVRHSPDARLFTWLSTGCKEEASLTFEQLRKKACSICIALRLDWQLADGDRALLVYPPGLDFIAAFVGCVYANVIAVPYQPPFFSTPA